MQNIAPAKILFVSDLNEYGRGFQRYKALLSLGHEVDALSMVPVPFVPGVHRSSFLAKLMSKLMLPLDLVAVNKQIRARVKDARYDIVWIEKGNTITPRTLRWIKKNAPSAKLVSCSEDDMYARHNRSLYFTRGLRYYDIVFTTKTYNLSELKLLGARRTALFLDAYDEALHRPLILSVEDKDRLGSDIGFVGTFEEDRALRILYLAEHGLRVVVWGNGWEGWSAKHKNLLVKNRPVYGEELVKVINATKINLCFLRKINRDEVTSRSVEIPACGGFMLGERTKRHLEFFEDGKEAVFFDTNEEMLALAKKYLANNEERKKIAVAGRLRCVSSGYSHRAQLLNMLGEVIALGKEER